MGKKSKTSEISTKRKAQPSKSADGPKVKKKAKVEMEPGLLLEATESCTLTMKELSKVTGLSESMLVVTMDLLDKSNPLTLIDIVCPNEKIRALNTEAIEAARNEFLEKKQSKNDSEKKVKTHTDDEIRKFIVEKAEKALQNGGVRIAGSSQYEKMDVSHKDKTLISDFLGYAQTAHGYFIYVYYVGPTLAATSTTKVAELRNPRNWLPVHKSHLSLFHKRFRDTKPFHAHTKFDQCNFQDKGALSVTPLYDPRHMMHRWLSKEGKVHKPLLLAHKSLFEKESDFLVKHYEGSDDDTKKKSVETSSSSSSSSSSSTLHYYDESKPDRLLIDLSMDVEQEGAPRFNVAQDKRRQQAAGYCYRDKELCHITIEEIPSLSRTPLPKEVDLTFEEFLSIAKRLHVDEKKPQPPEFYNCDPWIRVKAAIMSLNLEMQIRRLPAILGDEMLQILEADNMKPIIDYMGTNKACTDEIKSAVFRCLLGFMATDLMTCEEPDEINEIFEQRKGPASFVPLSM